MHVYLDCFPCFLRQTLAAARFVTDDEAIHAHVVDQVLGLLRCTDARQTPPAIGQQIHRLIRQATGNPDPYRKKKQSSNRLALRLYPQLKDEIRGSATPLETAVRLAVAGNVIDFGICHSLVMRWLCRKRSRRTCSLSSRPSVRCLRQTSVATSDK